MKKIFVLVLVTCLGNYAFSQQEALYSMNMYTKLYINPAFAGMDKTYNATLFGKDQWEAAPTSPSSFLFIGDAYLPSIGGGLGLTAWLNNPVNGTDEDIKLSYSYHAHLGTGTLGIGASFDYYRSSFMWPATPTQTYSAYGISPGLYYANEQGFYLGASVDQFPFLNAFAAGSKVGYSSAPLLYHFMSGYTSKMSDNWDMMEDFLVETSTWGTQVQLNLRAQYNKVLWFGIGYRVNNAYVPMLGFNVPCKNGSSIKFGYSHDYRITEPNTYNGNYSGIQEIMLQYNLKPKAKA